MAISGLRSRNLKFLRFVHRLDAATSGVLLLVKDPDAAPAYSRLFATRRVEKIYLAVVQRAPKQRSWVCRLKLAPRRDEAGRTKVDARRGKEAETLFRVLQTNRDSTLVEARPLTGRTHQIRVHLAESGPPVLGDALYGPVFDNPQRATGNRPPASLALRAVALVYRDPFQKRAVHIVAPAQEFCGRFGFVHSL